MEAERRQKDRGKRKVAVSRTKGIKEKKCSCDVMMGVGVGGCKGGVSHQECHRLWQHCSLLPFWPSVVGGTLMSTTLLPGDSSCADLSAICFCDTMR